jgi:hypothetical protein
MSYVVLKPAERLERPTFLLVVELRRALPARRRGGRLGGFQIRHLGLQRLDLRPHRPHLLEQCGIVLRCGRSSLRESGGGEKDCRESPGHA